MIWRLVVTADVPGIDYSATFEVPVFRTVESDTPLTAEELAALEGGRWGAVSGQHSAVWCVGRLNAEC